MIPKSTEASDVHKLVDQIIAQVNAFDGSGAWPEVERVLLVGVGDNFAAMKDSQGSPWPPRKDNAPHPLLRLTTAMYGAATEPGAAGHISQATADALKTGIDINVIRYARAQNKGYAPRNLPPREFMYVEDAVVEKVQVILWNAAAEQIF